MEEQVRQQVRAALSVGQPHPGLRDRVLASVPVEDGRPHGNRQWLMAAVAILIAVAIVASLLETLAHRQGAVPAHSSVAIAGHVQVAPGAAGLDCRLPVTVNPAYVGPRGGFISFPSGALSIDPAVAADPPTAKKLSTLNYDPAIERWVDVFPSMISPDGRSYAYTTNAPSEVHEKSLIDGRDVVLWRNAPGTVAPLGWTQDGLYVSSADVDSRGVRTQQVYVIDPARPGVVRQVGTQISGAQSFYPRPGAGALWSLAGGPDVKTPGGMYYDKVMRFDLQTGTSSIGYTAPGTAITLTMLAIDAQGRPLLRADPRGGQAGESRIQLLVGQDHVADVTKGSEPGFSASSIWSDSHGIWFAGNDWIWLYSNGALKHVATLPYAIFHAPSTVAPSGGKTGSVSDVVDVRVAGSCS